MKTFSSIKELLAILSREQKLLTEIFEKRKQLSYKYDYALEVVDYNADKIQALVEYAVLRENGPYLELDDQYLQFFEQILEVNEEINVSYISENLQAIRQNITYYLKEHSESRKYGYLRTIKSALRKTGIIAIRNVVDLKRNIDNTFKNEPNYKIKKIKLEHLDLKRGDITMLVDSTERLVSGEEEQTFFTVAADEELNKIIVKLKLQLNDCRHNLIEIQNQVIEFINQIRYQSGLVEKLRQLKYLKDQFELKSKTNILEVLEESNAVVFEPNPMYPLKLSLEQLQNDSQVLDVVRKVAIRMKTGAKVKQQLAEHNLEAYLESDTEEMKQVNLDEVKNSFLAGSNNLFDFLQTYDFGTYLTFEERLTVYCQLISQFDTQFDLTDQYQRCLDTEYLLIYPKAT
ncbi:hypothetical protein [Pontibacter chinhatensis]|uniref:Uncharacterized protein n=1 Tax=Pontibacter chinhatensis TaxID=1436961 RepID=A0A1I2QIV0_9BACT|nr:hypothetical protein [Pontibacter chinhatensis]SFG27900.1 hypothetical protein SAMN05421739_10216 [Pontibacter chinhatensis]